MFGMFKPKPAAVRKKELRDTELQLIHIAKQSEYFTGMARVLREQAARLKNEVAADDAIAEDARELAAAKRQQAIDVATGFQGRSVPPMKDEVYRRGA